MKEVICINEDFGTLRDLKTRQVLNEKIPQPFEGEILESYVMRDIFGELHYSFTKYNYWENGKYVTNWYQCENFADLNNLNAEINEALNKEPIKELELCAG